MWLLLKYDQERRGERERTRTCRYIPTTCYSTVVGTETEGKATNEVFCSISNVRMKEGIKESYKAFFLLYGPLGTLRDLHCKLSEWSNSIIHLLASLQAIQRVRSYTDVIVQTAAPSCLHLYAICYPYTYQGSYIMVMSIVGQAFVVTWSA